MGFWTSQPIITYMSYIQSAFCQYSPPQVLNRIALKKEPIRIPGVTYKRAIMKNAAQYSKFLETYFYINQKDIRLVLPEKIISDGLSVGGGWCGIEACDIDSRIIGIIFSLPIQYLYSSQFSKEPLIDCGMVDYFCVAPAWRSKGIASGLLDRFFNLNYKLGRLPHIFASEGNILFHKIPPFIKGQYIWREKQVDAVIFENLQITRNKPVHIGDIWSSIRENTFIAYNPKTAAENLIQIKYTGRNVLIHMVLKPTYEMKGTKRVGEIIAYWGYCTNLEKLYDSILDSIPDFDIFLATSSFPQRHVWNNGSAFAYYPFHFHPGVFDSKTFLYVC